MFLSSVISVELVNKGIDWILIISTIIALISLGESVFTIHQANERTFVYQYFLLNGTHKTKMKVN